MAIRGSTSKPFTFSAARMAISASCSAVGSKFTVASAIKRTSFLKMSMYSPAMVELPGRALMICSAGRMVSGYGSVRPATRPSASPACTIIIPKSIGRRCIMAARIGPADPLPFAHIVKLRGVFVQFERRGRFHNHHSRQIQIQHLDLFPDHALHCREESGVAISSSRIIWLARRILSSVPSGKTIRLGACCAL